ncbi:MAG TPA: N-methyl-L-tryptophan oxidase [Gemmatimonadaceae bacterium]|nr:N-methyl-L-tryptophan oxidase [Gemmatimonadaceae bacterium]
MTRETWDVIVVGLGAMGSATLHELAHRGHRVLGLDQFAPPHGLGSSHGRSRIIREAYFEDPRYVPLVQRAYERWHALEAESGVTLLRRTGGLMIGAPDSAVVRGALLSAERHGLQHQLLTADDMRVSYPAHHLREHEVAVYEPRAGMLDPERCIGVALDLARRHGAEVRTGETLLSWHRDGAGVHVVTSEATYRADRLVLSVGAWVGHVLRELALPFTVQRNLLYWFAPAAHAAQFAAQRFPIFIHQLESGLAWYGFPDTGDGVKVALHHHGEAIDPGQPRPAVSDAEVAFMRRIVAERVPDANGTLRDSAVCMYTNLPDGHFLIDRHADHPAVIIASPCSGHGFKFASAIGELLADMATGQPIRFDTSLFSLARFAAPG